MFFNKPISYFWKTCTYRLLHCDDTVLCVISSVWGPHRIFLFAALEETSGQSCRISISSSLYLLQCQLFPAARTDTPGGSERKSSQISFYPSVITPQKAPETAIEAPGFADLMCSNIKKEVASGQMEIAVANATAANSIKNKL